MNRVACFETIFEVLIMQAIFGISQVWMLGREAPRASPGHVSRAVFLESFVVAHLMSFRTATPLSWNKTAFKSTQVWSWSYVRAQSQWMLQVLQATERDGCNR